MNSVTIVLLVETEFPPNLSTFLCWCSLESLSKEIIFVQGSVLPILGITFVHLNIFLEEKDSVLQYTQICCGWHFIVIAILNVYICPELCESVELNI